MTFRYLTNKSCSRTSLILKADARNSLEHLLLSLEAHRQEDISKFPIQKSLMSRSLIVPSTGNPRAWKLAPFPPPLRLARARARAATKEIEYPVVVSLACLSLFHPRLVYFSPHSPPIPDRDIISRGKKFLMTENLIYIASRAGGSAGVLSTSSFSCN